MTKDKLNQNNTKEQRHQQSMYPSQNYYNLIAAIQNLGHSILRKIKDYDRINDSLKESFYNIDYVYMDSIILDLGKLLSITNTDNSGIRQLKKVLDNNYKIKIESLEGKYKDIIKKLETNRNKIIAHFDISKYGYSSLGFSELEINRSITDHQKYLTLINKKQSEADILFYSNLNNKKANSPEKERYAIIDFNNDKNIFTEIITEILNITRDSDYDNYITEPTTSK